MMGLFHWRDEGEPIRQGFNVYPLSSRYHLGGHLQIHRLRFYVRWSKTQRRLYRRVRWVPRSEMDAPIRGLVR